MADQLAPFVWRALDPNGVQVAAAEATWEVSGTTTPLTVFQNEGLTTPFPSPQVSDSSGVFDQPFIAPGTAAKVTVRRPGGGEVLAILDPVPLTSTGGLSAASVSFSPTTAVPADNVQDAIAVTANGEFRSGIQSTGTSPSVSLDNEATETDQSFRILKDGVLVSRIVRDDSQGLLLIEARNNAGANPKSYAIPDASVAAGANSSMLLRAGEMDARYKEHRTLAGQGLTGLTGLSITDLPANIEQLAISFAGVSIDASDSILVQLGTSSGFVTTGYAGRSTDFIGGYEPTSGFGIIVGSAASQFSGTMRLTRCSDDRYSQDHGGYLSVLNRNVVGGGLANFLSDVTQLRILTGSSGTFDNGIVQVHAITSPF